MNDSYKILARDDVRKHILLNFYILWQPQVLNTMKVAFKVCVTCTSACYCRLNVTVMFASTETSPDITLALSAAFAYPSKAMPLPGA